jgi:N-carbamoylputrescine amidase
LSQKVTIALLQMSCSLHLDENQRKVETRIASAAGQGAQIVCTQELYRSRYFPQVVDSQNLTLAERIDPHSGTLPRLIELARRHEIVLIASLYERRGSGIYHNTAVVIDADGTFLGRYRKMHIPDDPLYYEKFYFTPGDLGYPVFHTRYADLSILICWDQWFPEAARLCALKGAQIVFIPTAIGFAQAAGMIEGGGSLTAWQLVQQGHAVANAYFLACVNRVGFEPTPGAEGGIDFWGSSFVADPDGRIVKQAPVDRGEILLCRIDLGDVDATRSRFSFPYRDRRIDSYAGLTRRYIDPEI